MATIKFTCTALPVGKRGELPMDENGYRTYPVGSLSCYNSAGHFYTAGQGVRELFEGSSRFKLLVESGTLYGELGHPKQLPGQSDKDFYQRFFTIAETNISHHIKEVWIDTENVKDHTGKPVMAILAKVKPIGAQQAAAESMMSNPDCNTAFSLRGSTLDQKVNGVYVRAIEQICTYDLVYHPGMESALKYRSPALEALGMTTPTKPVVLSMNTLADIEIDYQKLKEASDDAVIPKGLAQESARHALRDLAKRFGGIHRPAAIPDVLRW